MGLIPHTLTRLVVATRNSGKGRELATLLVDLVAQLETLEAHPSVALPPEGDRSYAENALAKAVATHRALGVAALGDDSGLEVDALGGAPGLRSARFAGEKASDADNNALLLERLRQIPLERRSARFRCALALVLVDGREVIVEGTCEGSILEAPRGATGFGYDPLFLPRFETRSFAELPPAAKDEISHRGRAVAALRAALAGIADA